MSVTLIPFSESIEHDEALEAKKVSIVASFQTKPDTSLSFSYADTDAHAISATSVPVAGVVFFSSSGNTGTIYIGRTAVDTNSAIVLAPGERFAFNMPTDLNLWGYRFAAGSSGTLKVMPILYV